MRRGGKRSEGTHPKSEYTHRLRRDTRPQKLGHPSIPRSTNGGARARRCRILRSFNGLGRLKPTSSGARGAEMDGLSHSVRERTSDAQAAQPALTDLDGFVEERRRTADHATEALLGLDRAQAVGTFA